MEFEEWWHRNEALIRRQGSPYAVLFACEVLPRVKGLDFAFVKAEQPIARRYADFAIDEGGLVRIAIEVDSHEFHRDNQHDDREKDMELRDRGWQVLRFYTKQFGQTAVYNQPPIPVAAGVSACSLSIQSELQWRRTTQARLRTQPKLEAALYERESELADAYARIDALEQSAEARAASQSSSLAGADVATNEGSDSAVSTTELVVYEPLLAPALKERDALVANREQIIQDIMAAVLTHQERHSYQEAEERHRQDLIRFAAAAASEYDAMNVRVADLERDQRKRSHLRMFGVIAAAVLAAAGAVSVFVVNDRQGGHDGSKPVQLVSMTDAVRSGDKASISVAAERGTACDITYRTPRGTVSNAAGLSTKTADDSGQISWTWSIGSETKAGTGRVGVKCNSAHEEWPIEIME